MQASLEKYKTDLDNLISEGGQLLNAMHYEQHPKEFLKEAESQLGNKEAAKKFLDDLPSFSDGYQAWYSEAKSLVKQLLPDRLDDFSALFQRPRNRRELNYGNYVIEDYLYRIRRGEIVTPSAAIPRFQQQLNIVTAIKARFESSLFDIRQLVQADVFDTELEAAKELLKNKFHRAAGAMTGVVLESHLAQVAQNHNLKLAKKSPTTADWNDLLKENSVIETSQWRFIQHLGDLRNLCSHKKAQEPTVEEVVDLISGVEKITKTLF